MKSKSGTDFVLSIKKLFYIFIMSNYEGGYHSVDSRMQRRNYVSQSSRNEGNRRNIEFLLG